MRTNALSYPPKENYVPVALCRVLKKDFKRFESLNTYFFWHTSLFKNLKAIIVLVELPRIRGEHSTSIQLKNIKK